MQLDIIEGVNNEDNEGLVEEMINSIKSGSAVAGMIILLVRSPLLYPIE